MKHGDLASIRKANEEYCRLEENYDEAGDRIGANWVDSDVLIENELLWAETIDAGDGTVEVLTATRSLILAPDNQTLLPEKGYYELLLTFYSNEQSMHW